MNAHQVLVAARALITNKAHYQLHPGDKGVPGRIVGSIFTKLNGERTFKRDKAECFCSLGAIIGAIGCDAESSGVGLWREADGQLSRRACAGTEAITPPTKAQRNSYFTAKKYLENAIRVVSGLDVDIVGFNDGVNNHEMVLAAFDLAAKNAKRRHLSKLPKAVAK